MSCIVYQTNKRTGIRYAYESVSYWDKEKKQPRSKRTYVGRVDENTGEIIRKANSDRTVPEIGLSEMADGGYDEVEDVCPQYENPELEECKEEIERLKAEIAEKEGTISSLENELSALRTEYNKIKSALSAISSLASIVGN